MLNSMSGIIKINLHKAEKDTQNFKEQWQIQLIWHEYEVCLRREFKFLK